MMKRNYFGIRALLAGLAMTVATSRPTATEFNLGAIFMPTRRRKVVRKTSRKAGNKVARQCYQGVATMRNPGGVIAATFRDMQMRKHTGK